jgi:hypothetical protein
MILEKHEIWGRTLPRFSLFKLGLLVGFVFSGLIACNNGPILISNDVNLAPLFDIPLPAYIDDISGVMDTSILGAPHRFDHTNSLREEGEWMEEWRYSRYKEINGRSSTIQVTLILDSTIADSKAFFPAGCVKEVYRNELNANIEYFDQAFISYLEESRAGPEEIYNPLGYYTSCIAIRQSNLIIELDERTDFTDRSQINEVIKELAEAFYVISD